MPLTRKTRKTASQIQAGDVIDFGGLPLTVQSDALNTSSGSTHLSLSFDQIPFTSTSDRVIVVIPGYLDIKVHKK